MPRQFAHTTAEIVVQTVDAVHALGRAQIDSVAIFCDLSRTQVENALISAEDLGLLKKAGATKYVTASPLARFFSTPGDARKASLMRVVLESYDPFVMFRERLRATQSPDTAAQQTKAALDLQAHREEIKDTLISLGTFAGALTSQGGGRYVESDELLGQQIDSLAAAANDEASAEALVRRTIGGHSDILDRQEVVLALASALLKSRQGDATGTVVDAARAIESFLARLAERMGVNLAGATGINQKLDRFRPNNELPKKVVEAAKYLGQIRNAADHGVDVDPDVGSQWVIQDTTGHHYVSVACSFISAALEREANGRFVI